MSQTRTAFTLVELLVVISIIVILVSILVPGMEKALAASQKARCGTNLGGIGKAIGLYLNDHNRQYPMTIDPKGNAEGWYMLFGQLGQADYYNDPENDSDKRLLNKYLGIKGPGSAVKIAECPSDSGDQTIDPDGPTTTTNPTGVPVLDPIVGQSGTQAPGVSNVFQATGSSYVVAHGNGTGIKSAFGSRPMIASEAVPASSKVLVGDSPLFGNRSYQVREHRWHNSDKEKREFNLLFADYHVEFFPFWKQLDSPDYIESVAADDFKASRGYW